MIALGIALLCAFGLVELVFIWCCCVVAKKSDREMTRILKEEQLYETIKRMASNGQFEVTGENEGDQ